MINIYIGNLPYATSADDLASLFAPYGEVIKTAIVFDRETGRSRGFGFVEMADREAGLKAIEELAGKPFNGRPLTMNEARPRGSGKDNGKYASTTAVSPGSPATQEGGYRRYERAGVGSSGSDDSVAGEETSAGGYSGYRRADEN
ncbi:MAG: RNA-binding protein [Planctomycetota bacterium]